MLTFKEYITEIFDNPYPIALTKKTTYGDNVSTHRYLIQTDDKKKYHVHIIHDANTGNSEVGFHDENGSIDTTGGAGHKSGRVFASVIAAVKHHAKNTPTAKHITFDGEKDANENDFQVTGRNRLYASMANKLGGTTTDNHNKTSHVVSADKLRAA